MLCLTGRSVHHRRGGCGDLHHHGPLAGESPLLPHPLPSPVLQTRHQAPHPGSGAPQGGLQVTPTTPGPHLVHRVSLDLFSSRKIENSCLRGIDYFLQCQESAEPVAAGGAGPDRAGLRQSPRGSVSYQTSPADPASLQRGKRPLVTI